jgi:acetylornithine deacetylase/succinyl-diaminopimelate desuccinylase-like protein
MTSAIFSRLDDHIVQNHPVQIAFLQQLIQANSANPFTPDTTNPNTPVERDVAYLMAAKLREIGLKPELKGVSPARPNVLARLRGVNHAKTLILSGHMDTVMPSPLWRRDPFGGVIEGRALYGLGALDMKASLSVAISVAHAIRDIGIHLNGDLVLAFVVDEEPGGCSPFGSAYLLEQGLSGTAAIVMEPENTNITIGHRGGYRFKLTVHGEAAHTGLAAWERREKGKNAISGMAQAVAALSNLNIPYVETPAFPDRKPVFTFPTLIQGGTSINTVPDECIGYGDARLLQGVDAATLDSLICQRLDAVPDLDYTLEQLLFVPAVEISPDSEIVQILSYHTTPITGQEPTRFGCGPWNDGWMFITRHIPAVCGFGPNGGGVHSPEEHVNLDSLLDTTRILARAVIDYLGIVE